jgi:hypothetical protein
MASALLRSLLGAALRPPPRAAGAPIVLFATLPGEKHEIGLLVSALVAMSAGASPVFLGAELPAPELATAAELAQPRAVALAVTKANKGTARELAVVRSALPRTVEVWVGGPDAGALPRPGGVVWLASLEDLERHVRRLQEEPEVRDALRPPGAASRRASVRRSARSG